MRVYVRLHNAIRMVVLVGKSGMQMNQNKRVVDPRCAELLVPDKRMTRLRRAKNNW